ncbi:MAG: bifunctional phosphopantothenoylcysteine decarboxylase/phosphopantothenate--cysteine ligase CoaBC, partial [Betaproteobacteria bacterium]
REQGSILPCPLLMVPAMNLQMWQHVATQRSVARLKADGVILLGPASGPQACGEVGAGRMLEPEEILEGLCAFFQPKTLLGKQVVVTAGPTYEAIDPVRGLTNKSSGKMGFAIAKAALEAGASVHLIAGPVHLPTPLEFTGMIRRTDVLSAADMANAVESAKDCDIFFSVAAVADWKIINPSTHKIKKSDSTSPPLEFALNPDILARMAANSTQRPFCVGFAAETQQVSEFGQAKRIAKNVPLLIANHGPDTFGQDHNQVSLIDANGVYPLQQMDKLNLAREIIAQVVQRLPA